MFNSRYLILALIGAFTLSVQALPPKEMLLGKAEISAQAMCLTPEPFDTVNESAADHLRLCMAIEKRRDRDMTASQFCEEIGGWRTQLDCQLAYLELLDFAIQANAERLTQEELAVVEPIISTANELANHLCRFRQSTEETKPMWNVTDVGIVGLECKVEIKRPVLRAIVAAAPTPSQCETVAEHEAHRITTLVIDAFKTNDNVALAKLMNNQFILTGPSRDQIKTTPLVELFSEGFINLVLQTEGTEKQCQRVGSRGFMMGNGQIWLALETRRVISIND